MAMAALPWRRTPLISVGHRHNQTSPLPNALSLGEGHESRLGRSLSGAVCASASDGHSFGNLTFQSHSWGELRVLTNAITFSLQYRFGWSQYAPPPVEAKPAPLGKKEAALERANAVA
jgi:hypothetical protein